MRNFFDRKPFGTAFTGIMTAGVFYDAGCINDWHLIVMPLSAMLVYHLSFRYKPI
jgi:hypothetical protein